MMSAVVLLEYTHSTALTDILDMQNIHVFAFEMHCPMLLIVSTISDGLHDL